MAYTNKIDDEKVKNVIQQLFDEDFPYPTNSANSSHFYSPPCANAYHKYLSNLLS